MIPIRETISPEQKNKTEQECLLALVEPKELITSRRYITPQKSGSGLCGGCLRVYGSLDGERFLAFNPLKRQFDQFLDRLAAMIAGDFLMQVPPHTFDRIGVRSVLGQKVEDDPVPPTSETYAT